MGVLTDLRSGLAPTLLERIETREATVGVIGMGYVGLPLAMLLARTGFAVTGFDVDRRKVDELTAGRSYIKHIPADAVGELIAEGSLTASHDFARLAEPDAILICVPTPLTANREPDLSYVTGTAEAIGAVLRKGQLVVLESTTWPGTTREVVKPILERAGLRCGEDFHLAYSPEREDPGNPRYSAADIPKVVGGMTPECTRVAAALYGAAVPRVVSVSSPEVAESTKQLENIFRAVNVGLVNELKVLFQRMGINVWEVIEAASTKPFGFMPFTPGPGLGGHCLPIDPYYLTWRARQFEAPTRFIELAGEINTAMPGYVVSRLAEELNHAGKCLSRSKVLLLGMAYKPNVDDLRESPTLKLIELLRKQGATVSYNDPHIPQLHRTRHYDYDLASQELTQTALREADCVVIVTDHAAYKWDYIVEHAQLVLDTRNATRDVRRHRDRIRFA
ncbi:MAG: nucleotide sugar dehydrogenase [Armatimonadota bacterium]